MVVGCVAGIARSGMIDWMSVDDFRLCMEVNFLAVVSVYVAKRLIL